MAVAIVVFEANQRAEGAAAFLAAVEAMLGILVLSQRLNVRECTTTARRHSEHNKQLVLG